MLLVAGCQTGGPLLLSRPVLTGEALITPMFLLLKYAMGCPNNVWSIRVALQ